MILYVLKQSFYNILPGHSLKRIFKLVKNENKFTKNLISGFLMVENPSSKLQTTKKWANGWTLLIPLRIRLPEPDPDVPKHCQQVKYDTHWHYVCRFSRKNLCKDFLKKRKKFRTFFKKSLQDFVLKISIHGAKVCTKKVPNIKERNFIPAPLRSLATKQVIVVLCY